MIGKINLGEIVINDQIIFGIAILIALLAIFGVFKLILLIKKVRKQKKNMHNLVKEYENFLNQRDKK